VRDTLTWIYCADKWKPGAWYCLMGIKDGELHTPLLMLVHETILVIQALLCDELGDAITLLGTGTNVLLSPLSEGGRTSWK